MAKYKTLPKMTASQHRQVKKLTKKCCNNDHGNCLLLDYGESVPCVQAISFSLCCKWFRNAVLPGNSTLLAELSPSDVSERKRTCVICGAAYIANAPNAKYCKACAVKVRRKKKAECERNRRIRGHS